MSSLIRLDDTCYRPFCVILPRFVVARYGLIGRNGVGKSTLLRAMAERDGPVTESKLWCGVPLVDIRVIPV